MDTTQVDAMKDVVEILRNTNELFGRWGAISDNTRIGLIEVLNHMIEVRTKPLTDEQRERKNEAAKKRRIAKRQERDDLICNAIRPHLNQPHTADSLARIANDLLGFKKCTRDWMTGDEIHRIFDRHPLVAKKNPPQTAYTYQAWN